MSTPFNRTHPFLAKIKDRWPLTKFGSSKKTFHITLDIKESGLTYKAGDSLGVYASNHPIIVEKIILALKANPLQQVQHPRTGVLYTLEEFLEKQANLSRVTTSLLKQFQSHPDVDTLFQNQTQLQEILSSINFLDMVLRFGDCSFDLDQVIASISPLLPRFYSIASSQNRNLNEVDLLVSLTSFYHGNELQYGVASHFLCCLADPGVTSIPCYVQPTPHFILPADKDIDIIMVGPGTGVAPFRAFLQERLYQNAPGRNWLFFGERNRKTDFLYEEFWTSLALESKLSLDLAFSRDQSEKIYVQHRLLEKGPEIWSWLKGGAYLYVCGDADPMAKEVEAAILQICLTQGELPLDEAKAYLKKLRHDRRYLLDVY